MNDRKLTVCFITEFVGISIDGESVDERVCTMGATDVIGHSQGRSS